MKKRIEHLEDQYGDIQPDHVEIMELMKQFREAETEAEKYRIWKKAAAMIDKNSKLGYLRYPGFQKFVKYGWAHPLRIKELL